MSNKALTVIDKPQDLAIFQQGYVQEYEEQVNQITAQMDEAREAQQLTIGLSLSTQTEKWGAKIARLGKALKIASQYLAFYQGGFLPLPRMPVTKVEYFYNDIPIEALRRLKAAKELGLFDEFAVVAPQVNRDPILVGIKRFTDDQEVHCFIAWWR